VIAFFAAIVAQREKEDCNSCEYKSSCKDKNNKTTIITDFLGYLKNKNNPAVIEKILQKASLSAPQIEKCIKCHKHSYKLFEQQKFIPCFACNYYSKSLDILSQFITNHNIKEKSNRVILFLNALKSKQLFNVRSTNMFLIASSLRGMADVLLSCADENEEINELFLQPFFIYLEEDKKTGSEKNQTAGDEKNLQMPALNERSEFQKSKLEKSILYYWTASRYYRKASFSKDSVECMRKILQILIQYSKLKGASPLSYLENISNGKNGFDYIKEFIIQTSIAYLSEIDNHINLSEIQNQKWILDKKFSDRTPLYYLSNYPEVEEFIFLYYELLQLNKKQESWIQDDQRNYRQLTEESPILTSLRIESTVTQRINKLTFKAKVYKQNLKGYLSIEDISDFYKPDTHHLLLKKLLAYDQFSDWQNIIDDCKDALFCLTQAAEILYSTKLSKFTNSFIADNYREIFEWAFLFTFLRHLLYMDKNEDKNEDKKVFITYCVNSFQSRSKDNPTPNTAEYQRKVEWLYNTKQQAIAEIKETHKKMEDEILEMIGKHNRHFLAPNYSAEMAVKYYKKCLEAHREGVAYKEMIADMYLLDDDINNPELTFALAVERYRINSGDIQKKRDDLHNIYQKATFFEMGNYIKYES
jgi:hypothetical protein